MGLEDGLPLTWLLAEGLSSSLAFGRRAKFLTTWTSSEDCLSVHVIRQLTSCRISAPGEEAKEHFNSFYDLVWQATPSFLPWYQPLSHNAKLSFSFSQLQPSAKDHTWISDFGCAQNHRCPQVKGYYRFSETVRYSLWGFHLLPDFSSTYTMCLCYSVVVWSTIR